MNKKIDVVLFDFGGVLAEEGWKKGFAAIAEANGLNGDEMVQTAADTVYETGYITGNGSESSFWDAMRKKTGIRDDIATLKNEILSRFILRDWMMDLAEKLRSKNIRVGILSDQTNMLDTLNDRYDFFKYFDYVFNSYHMGKGKRDISLFDDITLILKASPNKILFIDDDPGHIERARIKDWQAILYISRDRFQSDFDKFISI